MDADQAVTAASELLAANSRRQSTLYHALDRNTVQAITFFIAYVYHQPADEDGRARATAWARDAVTPPPPNRRH